MKDEDDDGMLPEYNLKGKKGIRRIYGEEIERSHTVRITEENGDVTVHHYKAEDATITLAADVLAYFPDSDTVNNVLRALIPAIQKAKAQTE